MSLLHDVIEQLRTGQKLEKKHRDHQLTGDYECHIQPDCLLVYKIENNIMPLTLMRTGTGKGRIKVSYVRQENMLV